MYRRRVLVRLTVRQRISLAAIFAVLLAILVGLALTSPDRHQELAIGFALMGGNLLVLEVQSIIRERFELRLNPSAERLNLRVRIGLIAAGCVLVALAIAVG